MRSLVLLLFAPIAAAAPLDIPALLTADSTAVSAALSSPDTLTRTAAARVALVRNLPLSDDLRAALAKETDATAAREQLRALATLGAEVAELLAEAKRFPTTVDSDIAFAVARRDFTSALSLFTHHRGELRDQPAWKNLFTLAAWGRPQALPLIASAILGTGDEEGWAAVTTIARESGVAVPAPILTIALGSQSEEIRTATLWYVARGYAPDAGRLPEALKEPVFLEPAGASSDREAFGRELLRRMFGEARRENPRWLEWLDTKEADSLLSDDKDLASYFTDAEFAVREKRCRILAMQCPIPTRTAGRQFPPTPVAPPAFQLPTELPAGVAESVMRTSRCGGQWVAVASAKADQAGRIETVSIGGGEAASRCGKAFETLARLSLAAPSSVRTPLTTTNLVFVSGGRRMCLDEAAPSNRGPAPSSAEGKIRPPVVKRRVEPVFPAKTRQQMGPSASALVIVEALITRTGCVRSVRLVGQSPFPDINGAAILAISQWEFAPGLLNGEPVDVIFNLTINFRNQP